MLGPVNGTTVGTSVFGDETVTVDSTRIDDGCVGAAVSEAGAAQPAISTTTNKIKPIVSQRNFMKSSF